MARPKKQPTGIATDQKQVHYLLEGRLCARWRLFLQEEGGTEAEHHRKALELYLTSKSY